MVFFIEVSCQSKREMRSHHTAPGGVFVVILSDDFGCGIAKSTFWMSEAFA
jgi:hypothetical protein